MFGYFWTVFVGECDSRDAWIATEIMAESEQRNKDGCNTARETMVKQEKRENTLTNGGKGSGDDADSLEELPLDIGEHYLVRRSDDSWRA